MFKARGLQFTGVNQMDLFDYAVREPARGEAVVQTTLSAISPGTELRCLAGKQPDSPALPYVPGYAAVGTVIDSRDDVLTVGTRVVVRGTLPVEGLRTQWGGHASHHLCTAARLIRIPDGVSFEHAVVARLLGIPQHGVWMANVTAADRALVVGLGIIGMGSALLLKCAGAQVLAVDRSARRVELAKQMGLDAMVSGDLQAAARSRFEDGATIVSDATGAAAVISSGMAALRLPAWDRRDPVPACRYLIQGSYPGEIAVPYMKAFMAETSILFPRDVCTADIEAVLQLASLGKLDLSAFASGARSPEQAAQAYAELMQPETAPLTIRFAW
jgi:2-desacetyl-2-hydroxyethyl bacteriochlorophyllide A dehydrogenase